MFNKFNSSRDGKRRDVSLEPMIFFGAISSMLFGAVFYALTQHTLLMLIGALSGFIIGLLVSAVTLPDRQSFARTQSGRIGYLVLWLMGAPIGLLILLWVILGDNLIASG